MATDLSKFSRYRNRHFDRDAEFVVLRPLRVGGHDLRPGDHFNKSMTTLRMHKVLFTQRKIDEVGGCWHKISGLPMPPVVAFVPPNMGDVPFMLPADSLAADVPAKRRRGRPPNVAKPPKE